MFIDLFTAVLTLTSILLGLIIGSSVGFRRGIESEDAADYWWEQFSNDGLTRRG